MPILAYCEDDRRTCNHEKGRSKAKILEVVEGVAVLRRVDWRLIFSAHRESEKVASARVMAMAALAFHGVPLCHISRAFARDWATVYSAELSCARRYRQSSAFRKEWDSITKEEHEPEG